MNKKLMTAIGGFLALAVIFGLWKNRVLDFATLNRGAKGTKEVIVIDAGHGGFDPGKVGTANTLEKDVNLAIAKKVEKILTDSGYNVCMIRTEDVALCRGDEASKKMTDMKARVQKIEETSPALTVSIHQNSYSAATKGAQVFYYKNSEEGKKLAASIQQSIKNVIGDENKRVEKGNDSYYMLRKVSSPLVIVECGFLSNPEEEMMLKDEEYQQKMALGICEGVENFLYK